MKKKNKARVRVRVSGEGEGGSKCEGCEQGGNSVLANYVSGHMRHTIYGPDECLPKRAKRYRVMNGDEFVKYTNKVNLSHGFDVDGCTGSLPGGIFRVAPTSPWWAQAVLCAQFAVKKHAEDGGPLNLEYKQLIKANVQSAGGDMFYVTFTAIDNADGIEKVYRSKLWAPPFDLRLEFLECYTGSDKTAQELRMEITALFKTAEEKGIKIKTPEYYLNGNHPMGPRVIRFPEPKVKKDTIRPFLIFLNEIRSQKPNWKYATAKRVASRKWRSLGSHEKLPYIQKAQGQREEQSLGGGSSSHHA